MSEEIWVVCPKCKEMMQPPLKCGSCQFDNWKQDFCNQATDAITEQLDLIDFINIYAYCDGRTYKENLDLVAEVRRDALREGFRLGTENANDRVWGAFRANLMTSSQINAIEKEVYRILNVIFEDIEEQSDWYCDSLVEHKEQRAADQGQGQEKEVQE